MYEVANAVRRAKAGDQQHHDADCDVADVVSESEPNGQHDEQFGEKRDDQVQHHRVGFAFRKQPNEQRDDQ